MSGKDLNKGAVKNGAPAVDVKPKVDEDAPKTASQNQEAEAKAAKQKKAAEVKAALPEFVCGEKPLSFKGKIFENGKEVKISDFGEEIFKRLLESKSIVKG